MNYWLTTHWPPREDESSDIIKGGIWLPDGREAAGVDLKKDDMVLIYQARSGRPELRENPDGTEYRVFNIKGKEGIVAVCKARKGISGLKNSKPAKYADGSRIWWRWHAPLTLLSKSGFVPRVKVNEILGYKQNYTLRGFGDLKSGLKRLNADQFNNLLDLFKGNVVTVPYKQKSHFSGNGNHLDSNRESEEHFLLKMFVATNPSKVLGENNVQTYEVEYSYPTGDRADILLIDQFNNIIGVEIEVNVNDEQYEGPLQAIKYRYMSEVMTIRKPGDSRAILIAYSITDKMKLLCKEYNIHCVEVNPNEVKRWATKEESRIVLDKQLQKQQQYGF